MSVLGQASKPALTLVFSLEADVHLLVVRGVSPRHLLVIAAEEVAVATPEKYPDM
jgi:hypothetical protein